MIIIIYLSKEWADRIRPRLHGSIIFEATVNSLNEIAGWIVSRGEGIKVLAPAKLKERVIELAQGVLKNYNIK